MVRNNAGYWVQRFLRWRRSHLGRAAITDTARFEFRSRAVQPASSTIDFPDHDHRVARRVQNFVCASRG